MRHAVGAARVLAPPVGVPVGRLDELLVRLHVPVVHQVAGLLPAEQRVGRNAPRGAAEIGLALEEVQEQRRVVQPPLLPPAVAERLAEQFPRFLHAEEMLLVGRLLVGVGGRDLHLVDAEVVVEVGEHVDDRLRGVGVEERGVRVHREAARLGQLDRGHRLVEHAFLADRLVVPLLQAVDVHDPGEVGRRLELVQLLGQQQRVGAEEDELLPLDQLGDDHVDLRVHQRLAAGDGDHRGAALLDGADRLLDRHPLLEDGVRLLDLAAAGALQVAGEQRLELDQERELLIASQLLAHQVGPDAQGLT